MTLKRARHLILALSVLLAFSFSSCSKRYHDLPAFSSFPIYDSDNNSVGRFKTAYLADQIHAYFRGNVNGPIAVATFVDVNNLYGTSTFGRFYGEQLMSELAMRGYNVIELRRSEALQVMDGEGEFALSRDLELMQQAHNLSGLVVGTYTASPLRVYVNARIIDPRSSMIISVGSVEMQRTDELSRLIRANSFPTSMERIPVRSMGYTAYPIPRYWPYSGLQQPMAPPSMGEFYPDPQRYPEQNPMQDNQPESMTEEQVTAPEPILEPTT